MTEIILSLIGGLALFLYAVVNLSETIKEWAGTQARDLTARFTKNVFTAIIVGRRRHDRSRFFDRGDYFNHRAG